MTYVSMLYVGVLVRDASGRFARLGQQVPTAGNVTGQQDRGAADASEADTGSGSQDAMPVKQQGVDSDEEDRMQVDQQESDLIKSECQGQVSRGFAPSLLMLACMSTLCMFCTPSILIQLLWL